MKNMFIFYKNTAQNQGGASHATITHSVKAVAIRHF